MSSNELYFNVLGNISQGSVRERQGSQSVRLDHGVDEYVAVVTQVRQITGEHGAADSSNVGKDDSNDNKQPDLSPCAR